jgi:hypothetical protein
MTDRYQITDQVQALASTRVKELVLEWLTGTDGSLDDFEKLLETDYVMSDAANLPYGEFDQQGMFQPLTEAEMAVKSLQALATYEQTRAGIPHERVRAWLDSIGTANPLPCPR